MLNIDKIITKFYSSGTNLHRILMSHGIQVAKKSVGILDRMPNVKSTDRDFVIEASMLHDIGIFMTSDKSIGCVGDLPYLCHGFEGRKLLDGIGLFKHALVCERHTGVGLSYKDIVKLNLPLPIRDMRPISFEEKLICYSDKFFSKSSDVGERSVRGVLDNFAKHGEKNIVKFLEFHNYFN